MALAGSILGYRRRIDKAYLAPVDSRLALMRAVINVPEHDRRGNHSKDYRCIPRLFHATGHADS